MIYIAPPQYKNLWVEAMQLIAERPGVLNRPSAESDEHESSGLAIVQIHPKEYQTLDLAEIRETRQRRYGNSLLVFFEPGLSLLTSSSADVGKGIRLFDGPTPEDFENDSTSEVMTLFAPDPTSGADGRLISAWARAILPVTVGLAGGADSFPHLRTMHRDILIGLESEPHAALLDLEYRDFEQLLEAARAPRQRPTPCSSSTRPTWLYLRAQD